MAIADDRQRLMPAPEDLNSDRSQQLAYAEAHILTNPVEPCLRGEVSFMDFHVSYAWKSSYLVASVTYMVLCTSLMSEEKGSTISEWSDW